MIFTSILAKTFALALFTLHPALAAGLWIVSMAADFLVARKSGKDRGFAGMVGNLILLQVAALAIGWAAVVACDYAAMRWKDGIPVFASAIDGVLGLLGLSTGSGDGMVYLTTMAGPLEFAASIDGMGLKLPALFLALSAVWLLWAETRIREVIRKLGFIAGILIVLAILRMACIVMLANGLFDFIGYESEELPWRPFMDEAAILWIYLPFLLAAGVLLGRFLALHASEEEGARGVPRALVLIAFPLMLAFACFTFWQPVGSRKDGRLVISSYHSQWSRCDRPYDRDWYGADSGYNYACMKRLFGKFYQVAEAAGPLTAADLDGAGMLVVYDPDRRFSKEEIEGVHEFVRNGGGLLVIGDHTNVFGSTSHINELCEPFGFRFRDDVLFDLDEDFHQVMDAPDSASSFWHGISFFKLRGPTSIQPTSLWTRSVYEVGHSKSVRAIYSVNNFYPPPHDDPKMKFGTFCVASASRYGRGRVAAWADSTVFSNFEIFYPGKYEYLLNTMDWLNHRDDLLPGLARRMAPLVLLVVLGFFLARRREPRAWLVTLLLCVVALGVARWVSCVFERRSAEFPKPIQPSDWVVFAAEPKDPGHHLRDFISEEPYDQRYEVFIQWVLRTGAFSGFHLLGPKDANGLYEHLRSSEITTTAKALIVRKPDDLRQLGDLAAIPGRANDPLLLMFSSTIPVETAVEEIKKTGLVRTAGALERIPSAWPSGEVLVDDGGRRVLVIAGAERFSDQAMGISEKVTPDARQRELFNQEFSLIDRLFGRGTEEAPK